MLEVFITIVILTIGLLGLAGLQSRLQASEMEAYQRAQALILLNDMASRIATNRANAASYVTGADNPLRELEEALQMSLVVEPIDRRLRVEGIKTGRVTALDVPGQIGQGLALGILSPAEADLLRDYDRRVIHIINVDDFAPGELPAGHAAPTP